MDVKMKKDMKLKTFTILTAAAVLAGISVAGTAAMPPRVHGVDVCTLGFPAGETVRQSLVHAVVTGRVTDSATGEPVPDVNVMLQTPDGRALYGFTTTDGYGRYRFEYSLRDDSVRVMITGFNIRKAWKNAVLVPGKGTAAVDFEAVYEALEINEVTVTAEPVRRRGDTLSYLVGSYIDTLTDRAIGDVLRKMPGIDVSEAGQVYYNNRPINRFYIEGLDLMGGRYGVAVNNVRARDIKSVEVLENHQPIKALKDVEFSPDAAINLRLKDGAKGSLIATLSLGVGYKPWMWNGELALMLFTAKYQMMTTVKSNNSGDDVSSELTSFYDSFQKEYSPLSVHLPALPDTDRERYMDNLTQYYGSLSRVGTYNIDNLSQGWGIEGKIEKRFDAISTTVGIPVGFRRTWMDILRQGEVMPVSTWSLPVGIEVSSRLARSAFLEYYIRYVRSSSSTQDEALTPINALHQRLGFNFVFFKRLTFNISGEHYLNDAITSGSRNIFFLDAYISFRAKRTEYILEGRNLLNTGTYNQRVWSDITNYQYNYILRPLSVMFKIRFSIGAR